ncbi:MAG: zf-HC2 domain-containing protein [Blastocatellia bacterium]|nr:zf-HC2 domain-containing protein [Blastocatellia bacterium]
MVCNQCQEIISDYIDGSLELGEQVRVERHLADCEPCRAVRDDLLQIIHFSQKLPLQSPSGAVWARIQSSIEAERPAGLRFRFKVWIARLRDRHFDMSIPQLAAGALALAILVSVSLLALRRGDPPSADMADGQAGLSTNLLSSTDLQQMEQRINELKETVDQNKVAWTPELRVTFDRSLLYVDQSLIECRRELGNNPADPISQELMLNAYREKMRVLEEFARF